MNTNRITANILSTVGHLIAPEVCPLCRKDLPTEPDGLCQECPSRLQEFQQPRCNACGGAVDGALAVCSECVRRRERPWEHAVSVFPFQTEARAIVHRLKYSGQPWLASFLGYHMAQNWLTHGQGVPEALVPVPLHPVKYWRRGYNQAALLAQEVGRHLNTPVIQVLRRQRWSKTQAGLTYEQRRTNTKSLFACKKNAEIHQRHIVVVDDVLTTGSTLEAAVNTLQQWKRETTFHVLTAARG